METSLQRRYLPGKRRHDAGNSGAEENAVRSNKVTRQERVWCMVNRNHRMVDAQKAAELLQ